MLITKVLNFSGDRASGQPQKAKRVLSLEAMLSILCFVVFQLRNATPQDVASSSALLYFNFEIHIYNIPQALLTCLFQR